MRRITVGKILCAVCKLTVGNMPINLFLLPVFVKFERFKMTLSCRPVMKIESRFFTLPVRSSEEQPLKYSRSEPLPVRQDLAGKVKSTRIFYCQEWQTEKLAALLHVKTHIPRIYHIRI